MKLERIYIKGFKSFHNIDIKLANLNVLIGANGAGKSNFLSVFRFAQNIARGELQTFIGQRGGANRLLHFGRDVTEEMFLKLYFDVGNYECNLAPTDEDSLFFKYEEATYYSQGGPSTFHTNAGITANKESVTVSLTGSPFIKSRFIKSFLTWQVYHFDNTTDNAGVKQLGDLEDNKFFRSDGANLAPFLYLLRERHRKSYHEIVESVRLIAPFFKDFALEPSRLNPDKIRLEWQHQSSDAYFNASQLSDGTLRMMCLTTLLLQPQLPTLIVIDEPELGLHPFALNILAGLMRKVASKTQLIISTQSTHLVNQFELDDLLVVNRNDGASTIERLSLKEYEDWLEDYSVGELWEKNVIGGRPS